MECATPFGRLIDLTRPLDRTVPGVDWETAKSLDKDGWNARLLRLYSHAATHVDAPLHFGMPGPTIEKTPLAKLALVCHLVDVNILSDGQLMGPEVLDPVAGRMKAGEGILFRTGWSNHHGTDRYRNGLPRMSPGLVARCGALEVDLVGTEAPSIADVNNLTEVTDIHRALFGLGITIVEGLVNLEIIEVPRVFLLALPLPVAGGDGAPGRVVAFEMPDA